MICPNSHIAAMAPYALADLEPPQGKRLISLAQNESAISPSPLAIKAGEQALAGAQLYPDPEWCELRASIAQVHNISAQNILCGAGSMEIIASLVQCYASPDTHVLSSQYGYAFFCSASLVVGAPYDQAPEDDMTVSVDALLGTVHSSTSVVFIANPGNPTGTRINRADIVRLREELDDQILLVVDEAYGEFAEAPNEPIFDLVERGNVVVLRTFSKAYGLAGARVGWGLFPPGIAREVRKVLNPNNISCASQAMAVAAMMDQAHMHHICAETTSRRNQFTADLRQFGLTIPESHTNFVLIRFEDAVTAQRADHALRAEGVFMRGMAGYGLPQCLRATIGEEKDMNFTRDVLKKWFNVENSK